MAGPYDSLLNQQQPSYGGVLNQQAPSYDGLLSKRSSLLDQTASGQPLNPQQVAAQDQETATFLDEARKGLRRFGFSTIASTQAFAGAMIEPVAPQTGQGLIQSGLRTMQDMPHELAPAVEKWGDVHDLRSGALKFASAVGEGLPSSALAVGAGLAGRGLGAGLAARAGLRGTAAGEAMAARYGYGAGMASMVPQEGGETALELAQDPVAMANTTPWQRAGLVAGRGTINAALENIVPQALVVPQILGKAARIQPGLGAGLRNIGLLAGEGALGEYGTEFAQELTGQAAQRYANPQAQWDLQKAHEAGLSGAATGLFLGGAGGGAQALHSNLSQVSDLVGAGVDKVKEALPGLPKAPTFDDLVGHVQRYAADPAAAGRDLADGTLFGVAKAAEAAGTLKQYGLKGIDTAEDVLSNTYDRVAKFITQHIEDPEKKEYFARQAAELKTMTMPEWDLLKKQMNKASTTGEFLDGIGMAGAMAAKNLYERGERGVSWVGNMAQGYYDQMTKGAEGKQASLMAPDAADRTLAMKQFYSVSPKLKDILEAHPPSLNERRRLGDFMHFAINDPSYLERTHDPATLERLQTWHDNTGTDLRKIVQSIIDKRNDVDFKTLLGDSVSKALHQLNIDPQHRNDLLAIVKNTTGDYTEQPKSIKNLLFSLAGKNELKATALYNTLHSIAAKRQAKAEGKLGAGQVPSFLEDFGKIAPGGSATGLAGNPDHAAGSVGVDRNGERWIRDTEGNLVNPQSELVSPFDQEAFKRALATKAYSKDPKTFIPITLKPQGEHAGLDYKTLANAFGERIGNEEDVVDGKKLGDNAWVPHKRVEWTREDGLKLKINPMSLTKMVRDSRFRNQFQEHMIGFEDRPGASENELTGQRFMNVLSTLLNNGIHIDPEAVGLPKGSEPIHVKVGVNMAHVHDNLILNRYKNDPHPLTWADVSGKNRGAMSRRLHLERLDKFGGNFKGAYNTLSQEGDKGNAVSDKIAGVIWTRAKEGIRVAERAERYAPIRNPSPTELDTAAAEYHALLPNLKQAQENLTNMRGAVTDILRAYKDDVIQADDVHRLIRWFNSDEEVKKGEYTKIRSLLLAAGVDPAEVKRNEMDTTDMATRLADGMTRMDLGQEEFDKTKYGAGEDVSQASKILQEWLEHKYSLPQKTVRAREAVLKQKEKQEATKKRMAEPSKMPPVLGGRISISWRFDGKEHPFSAAKYIVTAVEKKEDGTYRFSFRNEDEPNRAEYKNHLATAAGESKRTDDKTAYHFLPPSRTAAPAPVVAAPVAKAEVSAVPTPTKPVPSGTAQKLAGHMQRLLTAHVRNVQDLINRMPEGAAKNKAVQALKAAHDRLVKALKEGLDVLEEKLKTMQPTEAMAKWQAVLRKELSGIAPGPLMEQTARKPLKTAADVRDAMKAAVDQHFSYIKSMLSRVPAGAEKTKMAAAVKHIFIEAHKRLADPSAIQKIEDEITKLGSLDDVLLAFEMEMEGAFDPMVKAMELMHGFAQDDERFTRLINTTPQKEVTFIDGTKAYSHDQLNTLLQGWAKKYLPDQTIKLHIYESKPGVDPHGFVWHSKVPNTIFLDYKAASHLSTLSTLSHEFGHLIQYNAYDNASQVVKDKIFAAYKKDMEALRTGTMSKIEAMQRFGNARMAHAEGFLSGKAWEDLTSDMSKEAAQHVNEITEHFAYDDQAMRFSEWFANQFSKYVTQGINKSLSPAEKSFWKALIKSMKAFFNDVVKRLTPNAEFETWVQSLAAGEDEGMPDIPFSTGEGMPPTPPPPTPPPPPGKKSGQGKKPPPPPPPPPPTPPPSGGGKKPRLTKAQKKFIAVVESMMGNKVAVRFNQVLEGGVQGTFETRRELLDKIGNQRRAAIEELNDVRGNPKATANVNARIKELEDREKEVLAHQAVQGFIDLASGMEKKNGLAEHETFHAAFHIFFSPEEKRILGTAFTRGLAGKRLREIFKNDPIVLKRIDESSEEAAAYAFQVWAENPDNFQLGPQVETLFQKFLNFIRKIFGVLTNEEKADQILKHLKSGERFAQAISPVARKLDKDLAWQERAQNMAKDVGGLLKNAYDLLLEPSFKRLMSMNNPPLAKIAELAYQPTGTEGNTGGMVQRGRLEFRKQQNKLTTIFQDLSEAELKDLHMAMVLDKPPADAKLTDRVDALRAWYKDMYKYQIDADVRLNDAGIKSNYYPLTWDPEKVLKNKKDFIDMLETNYSKELHTTKKTANEIYDSITSYIERGDDLVNVMGSDMEPISESTKTRTLAFIKREHRLPFMDDDPIHTSNRYAKQAIRQAEYVRAFGMKSSKLKALRDEARDKYGATASELALVDDYIDGVMGNKEIGMSRELKDLYGAMNVYQNYRLLPFSLFSSLIDPMGIAIRSGRVTDAWETFTYSMKGLFKEWKADYPRDFWEKLAEDWGTIEHSGTSMNTTHMYDGITLRGTTKELNDKLFKYNLLNGWIRNNTIMATKAAQRSFYRAAEGDMGKHSERYLTELGLEKSDIVYDKAQDRILLRADELEASGMSKDQAVKTEEKLRNATDKFVRQALLNPSSPELPNWASNPYLMPIAHLKQFVFAFNATIIDRITHELEHGNFKPIGMAASYVPAMIAADFVKDMIAGFGDEPPYKKNWGAFDYFNNGLSRSGLTGTGQFFNDAQEDVVRGGVGLAGPMAQQIQQGVKAFSGGDSTAIKNWMIKAGPFQPAYRQYLTGPEPVHS